MSCIDLSGILLSGFEFGKLHHDVAKKNKSTKEEERRGSNPPIHPVVEISKTSCGVHGSGEFFPCRVKDAFRETHKFISSTTDLYFGGFVTVPSEDHKDEEDKEGNNKG